MSRRPHIDPSIAVALVAFVSTVVLTALDVAAQCALCGSATPYAGTSARRTAITFALAALALLVPTIIAVTAIGRSMWRHRDP